MVRLSWLVGRQLGVAGVEPEVATDRHTVGGREPAGGALILRRRRGEPESRDAARRLRCRAGRRVNRLGHRIPAAGWTRRPGERPACRCVEEDDLGVGVPPEPVREPRCRSGAPRPRPRAGGAPRTRHRQRRPPDTARLRPGRARSRPRQSVWPSSARPIKRTAGEVLVEEVALGGPGLEHATRVGDEHPVGADLGLELVGLVEQIGRGRRLGATRRCARRRPAPGPGRR